jgi:hypothetical protein
MGNALTDALKANTIPASAPGQMDMLTPEASAALLNEVARTAPTTAAGMLMGMIDKIELDAVIGGALMRLTLAGGVDPTQVKPAIMAADPSAKVRDDFPRGGFGGGNRETKTARCVVINVRVTDSGKFIDLVCQNGEDLSVAVSKKKADGWLDELKALNKLSVKNLDKLQAAFDSKGAATVILSEDQQFGVGYWKTDDGKAFMENMTATPPAATEEKVVAA